MVKLTMDDDRGSYEKASFNWDKITHSLQPETESLPKKDREYFESNISFLIGKDIRLSNLPKEWLYIYIQRADHIFTLTWYPMLVPPEYINKEIGKYENRLGLPISLDGLGWKFGPMGFQQQHVKQEVIGMPVQARER